MRFNKIKKIVSIVFISGFVNLMFVNSSFAGFWSSSVDSTIVSESSGSVGSGEWSSWSGWSGEELIKAAIKNSKDLFNPGKNPVFYHVNSTNDKVSKDINNINTIVVFYDYNCSYSRELMNILKIQIEKIKLEKKLYKIIFRPIGIMSDTSRTIAELVLAAYQVKPEKFFDLHEELLLTRYILPIGLDNIRSAITKVGLNYDDLAAMVEKQALRNEVLNNQIVYDNIKFPGVPSIILAKLDSNSNIINDKIYYVAGSDRNQFEYKLYRISIN